MTLKMKELLNLKHTRVLKADVSHLAERRAIRPAYAAMSTSHYRKIFGASLRPWQEALKEYLNTFFPELVS